MRLKVPFGILNSSMFLLLLPGSGHSRKDLQTAGGDLPKHPSTVQDWRAVWRPLFAGIRRDRRCGFHHPCRDGVHLEESETSCQVSFLFFPCFNQNATKDIADDDMSVFITWGIIL